MGIERILRVARNTQSGYKSITKYNTGNVSPLLPRTTSHPKQRSVAGYVQADTESDSPSADQWPALGHC